MTEVKNPLQLIQEGLNEPAKVAQPTQFDNEAVASYMIARNRPILFPPYSITRNARLTKKDKTEE